MAFIDKNQVSISGETPVLITSGHINHFDWLLHFHSMVFYPCQKNEHGEIEYDKCEMKKSESASGMFGRGGLTVLCCQVF